MSITGSKPLRTGDVLLVCTDGFWSGLDEVELASTVSGEQALQAALKKLAESAVTANAPYSDNTTVAALRWQGR